MTNEEAIEIDEHLQQLGYRYDPDDELFKMLKGRKVVDWSDVLAAMPHFSLNDLMAFEEKMQSRNRKLLKKAKVK